MTKLEYKELMIMGTFQNLECTVRTTISSHSYFRFSFTNLSHLDPANQRHLVDVIAVVKKIGELKSIPKETKTLTKRNLILVDESGERELVLWEDRAVNLPFDPNLMNSQVVILAMNGVKVGSFNSNFITFTKKSHL
jgi:hypothetical protein